MKGYNESEPTRELNLSLRYYVPSKREENLQNLLFKIETHF